MLTWLKDLDLIEAKPTQALLAFPQLPRIRHRTEVDTVPTSVRCRILGNCGNASKARLNKRDPTCSQL